MSVQDVLLRQRDAEFAQGPPCAGQFVQRVHVVLLPRHQHEAAIAQLKQVTDGIVSAVRVFDADRVDLRIVDVALNDHERNGLLLESLHEHGPDARIHPKESVDAGPGKHLGRQFELIAVLRGERRDKLVLGFRGLGGDSPEHRQEPSGGQVLKNGRDGLAPGQRQMPGRRGREVAHLPHQGFYLAAHLGADARLVVEDVGDRGL